jgi:hypothetical protein
MPGTKYHMKLAIWILSAKWQLTDKKIPEELLYLPIEILTGLPLELTIDLFQKIIFHKSKESSLKFIKSRQFFNPNADGVIPLEEKISKAKDSIELKNLLEKEAGQGEFQLLVNHLLKRL